MQKSMRDIVNGDQDGSLLQYGSFFFVLEGKGVGLGLNVEDMEVSDPMQPLKNLEDHFSKIDFDYIMDWENGESFFYIAFCVNPKSALTAVRRLEALEASFGAGGFLSGKQFPLNTMPYYGSMQAEMAYAYSPQINLFIFL
jgi:hypothetical protein